MANMFGLQWSYDWAKCEMSVLGLCCVLLAFAIGDSSGYDGQTCGDRDQPIGELGTTSNRGRLLSTHSHYCHSVKSLYILLSFGE